MSKTGSFFTLLILLLFAACGEEPVVNIYPPAKGAKIEGLALVVDPPDPNIKKSFESLYRFDPEADTVLYISHKERILCNSNQNVQQKALSRFPHNFLRMELRRGATLYYSYYIDLDEKADKSDIERAFGRMKRDLGLR